MNGQVNARAPGYRPAVSGSNRGFWKVVLPLVIGGILLVVLVLVFRPSGLMGERVAERA